MKANASALFLIVVTILIHPSWAFFRDWPSQSQRATPSTSAVLGIDFGSSFSSVAIETDGRIEVLSDSVGRQRIPSCVSFTYEGEPIVSDDSIDCTDSISHIKAILGKDFHDKEVQEYIQQSRFQIVNVRGKPVIRVPFGGTMRDFTPEEIASAIFARLKSMAESFLGISVSHAVVSSPQRQAIKKAASLAGLNILQIINAPIAAAIAFRLEKSRTNSNILICRIGGRTSDTSLYRVHYGALELIDYLEDTHLGGEDFNNRLIDHLLGIYEHGRAVHVPSSIPASSPFLIELNRAVEEVKGILSTEDSAVVRFDIGTRTGDRFSELLTRVQFEEVNHDLFLRVLAQIEDVLFTAKLSSSDVDKVLLVGGSSQIPKLRQIIQDFFGRQLVDPTGSQAQTAIAIGAAMRAGLLAYKKEGRIQNGPSVLALPLVAETTGPLVTLIPAGSSLPRRKYQVFSTSVDGQDSIAIRVFLGTSRQVYLGTLTLTGIVPAPRGAVKFGVTFAISDDFVLDITAHQLGSSQPAETLSVAGWRQAAEDAVPEAIEVELADISSLMVSLRKALRNIEHWNEIKAATVAFIDKLDRWLIVEGPRSSHQSRLDKWGELTDLISSGSVILSLPPATDPPKYTLRRFIDEL